MNVLKIAKLLPALGIACMVSLPAMAQTSPGTMSPMASGTMAPTASGTMSPMASGTMAPTAKATANKHAALPANEHFSTESAASAHCPGGTVVWAAMGHSKAYHSDKSKYYGKTKHGAYACKSDLDAAGFHQAKN